MSKAQQQHKPNSHTPVMLEEMLAELAPCDDQTYVDATFGAGGYSRAILNRAQCEVIAIDRDPQAEKTAQELVAEYDGRLAFVNAPFGDLRQILAQLDQPLIDGIVLDVGVSSMQIDEAGRGFSFQKNGPLDMRMGEGCPETAAELIASCDEKDLASIIWEYGQERHSRRIAKAIVMARKEEEITKTGALANIVRKAVPGPPRPGQDKATLTFQALRIAVNDELGELKKVLEASLDVVRGGGRIVVVSFHSLEDKIVKQFFRDHANANQGGSRHMPDVKPQKPPRLKLMRKKALKPREEEIKYNPRARSARMRTAIRLPEPGLEQDREQGRKGERL